MEEGLIECVRARPALYDKTDRRYSNRDIVNDLWEEIASELNAKGNNSYSILLFKGDFVVPVSNDTKARREVGLGQGDQSWLSGEMVGRGKMWDGGGDMSSVQNNSNGLCIL